MADVLGMAQCHGIEKLLEDSTNSWLGQGSVLADEGEEITRFVLQDKVDAVAILKCFVELDDSRQILEAEENIHLLLDFLELLLGKAPLVDHLEGNLLRGHMLAKAKVDRSVGTSSNHFVGETVVGPEQRGRLHNGEGWCKRSNMWLKPV